jgi:hypothetical protein
MEFRSIILVFVLLGTLFVSACTISNKYPRHWAPLVVTGPEDCPDISGYYSRSPGPVEDDRL